MYTRLSLGICPHYGNGEEMAKHFFLPCPKQEVQCQRHSDEPTAITAGV